MSGQVNDGCGRPAANVAIRATPIAGTVAGCSSAATSAAPASTTTDSHGNYSLPLDPGTSNQPVRYQLDFDPPAGSTAPRLTQSASVSGTDPITNDVTLQAGALITGTVTDSDQTPAPVPSATVRLFDTSPCSALPCPTEPVLRGQGITDTNGNFQIVVPLYP